MDGVEVIRAGGKTLAYIIRRGATAKVTEFVTPNDTSFQAGFVVYEAGGEVTPHVHLPIERRIVGTSEMLLVRAGRCDVDIYTDERELVASRGLEPGDMVLSLGGGHGFRMSEDTILFEVKQGPFLGSEKERFARPGRKATAGP